MDFKTGKELLEICETENLTISSVMKKRECTQFSVSEEETDRKMQKAWGIMKESVRTALTKPVRSMSGMIGGEAAKIYTFGKENRSLCDPLMNKMIAYSMAVLEVNASMGLIVAAPTAGSSGVLPGVMLALQEERNISDEMICEGLIHASAIGYLLMRNASVSGAEAGCQAEVGAASAMAAGTLTQLMGGTPQMCLEAAGMAIANLLGLVCDPVAGLVEIPCQSRNSIGTLNAAACAQIILSGAAFPIPFDEMAEALYRVGRYLPPELRETSQGGCAGTATGCAIKCSLWK